MDPLTRSTADPSPPGEGPAPPRLRHRGGAPDLAVATLLVAGAATVAATFAPWHHSGAATRHSYELIATAERFGVVDGAGRRVFAIAVPLLPLLVALAAVALAWGARRLGAALALLAGLLAVTASALVLRADVESGWGATATLVAGSILAVAAVVVGCRWRPSIGGQPPRGR